MTNKRDDFTKTTKNILALRVGVRCSNPACRKLTSGPNADPNKSTNLGVAAHICAAAKGGQRYDPTMSPQERKSVENGIWLCQSCSKLIDSDPTIYTKDKLLMWKTLSEMSSKLELESSFPTSQNTGIHPPQEIETLSNRWFRSDEERKNIAFGYHDIDSFCNLTSGSLLLIAGYSDSDNSMFFQNVVRNNMRNQRKIVYFNFKETSTSVLNKMLSAECHVEYEHIRTASLTKEEWERLALGINSFDDKKLIFEPYNSQQNTSQYVLNCVKYSNADLIVIDDLSGLGLENQDLASYMYQLRSIATESNTTIFIVLNLTNTQNNQKKKVMLDSPQISELNKFFDVVQFLLIDEDCIFYETTESDEMELIFAKSFSPDNKATFRLHKYAPYFLICAIEKPDGNKKESKKDKYPGLYAGAQVLVDLLKDI